MRLSMIVGTSIFGVALGLGFVGCNDAGAAPSQETTSAVQVAATKQARFKVDGMTCGSCNVAVKVAAEKVDGVSKAGASHEKKSAWAVYDPTKTNPKAIAEAITKAGYPATLVE